MKKQKKFLVFTLIATLFVMFAVVPAHAAWFSNATIDTITVTTTGNYTIKATSGSFTAYFTIISTSANANACLATLLTAQTNGSTVTFEYTGSTISAVYLS